jgi:hypothetical protein
VPIPLRHVAHSEMDDREPLIVNGVPWFDNEDGTPCVLHRQWDCHGDKYRDDQWQQDLSRHKIPNRVERSGRLSDL